MSALGFESELSMGNHANDSILALNKNIIQRNRNARNKHMTNISDAKSQVSALGTSNANLTTVGETVLGQTAGKGKDIEAGVKAIGSIPKAFGVAMDVTDKYAVGGVNKAVDTVSSGIARLSRTATSPPFIKTADSLFQSDKELVASDPNNLSAGMRLARASARGTSLSSDVGSFLKSGTSVGETIAERGASVGKLGLAGAGLSVGLGLMDAVGDIDSGKIEGNNSAERVSNVAGMVSGGLEAVGTALDLTGVGAPVGVALNILGGLAGLVGGGAEIVGEDEEKKQAQTNVANVTKQAPVQQKQVAFSDMGSSGAEVKSNIQNTY